MSGKLSPIRLSGILLFASTLFIVAETFQYRQKKTSHGDIFENFGKSIGRIWQISKRHHDLTNQMPQHLQLRALHRRLPVIERNLESELRTIRDNCLSVTALHSEMPAIERDYLMKLQEKEEIEPHVPEVKSLNSHKRDEPKDESKHRIARVQHVSRACTAEEKIQISCSNGGECYFVMDKGYFLCKVRGLKRGKKYMITIDMTNQMERCDVTGRKLRHVSSSKQLLHLTVRIHTSTKFYHSF